MLGEQMLEYLRIKFQDHWYPDRPAKGSAYRSIRISKEKVDKILVNAAIDIGLDLQEILDTLPNDLTIWIDPGEVSYRIGEKGLGKYSFKKTHKLNISDFLVEFLYEDEKRHLIRNSESSSDSEEVSHHHKTFSTSSIEPINYDTEEFQSLDPLTISEFSSWTNSISTPVLSAQTFAQTKFGSLKNKTIGRKHQTK
jgi:protein Tob/BTG